MSLKQINLSTTISAKATSLPTSRELIATGVGSLLSTPKQEKAALRLMDISNPEKIDQSLLSSLESLTGYPVNEVTSCRYNDHRGVDILCRGFKLRFDSIEVADKAVQLVACSFVGMPKQELSKRLAVLSTLVVKPTGESSKDLALRVQSLSLQLQDYPADIVDAAIKEVQNTTTFWPSYSEFYKHVKWRMMRREKLYDSVVLLRNQLAIPQ